MAVRGIARRQAVNTLWVKRKNANEFASDCHVFTILVGFNKRVEELHWITGYRIH
jgi:hypothetical protein